MKFKFAVLLFASFYLAACAHTPTKGDKMLSASNQAKELGNTWDQGNQLVSKGIAQQKNGMNLISEGEAQVAKGEKLIAEGDKITKEGKQQIIYGKKLQQESENNFNERFPASALNKKAGEI